MNSDDKGDPQIPEIKYNVKLKQQEEKVWQALVLISPAFVESLVLREQLRTLSKIHASRVSGSSSSVGNLSRSSSPLHAADSPSRSSGSLLCCITSKSARNTCVKVCSTKLLPIFFASISHCVWRLSGIFSGCIVPASGVIHNQVFSFCAGVQCQEVLLPRLRTCFPCSSNLLDLLLS